VLRHNARYLNKLGITCKEVRAPQIARPVPLSVKIALQDCALHRHATKRNRCCVRADSPHRSGVLDGAVSGDRTGCPETGRGPYSAFEIFSISAVVEIAGVRGR
jgi:hypothetical protein